MHIYIVFCNVHIMKGVLKMKKSLKKIIMVVLTFAMMFAMTVPAYAKEVFKILKTNATIYSSKTMENRRCYNPDELIYVVDKRQELYFTQVFRCARKTGIVKWSVTGSVPEYAAERLLSEAETAAVSDCQEQLRGFRQA